MPRTRRQREITRYYMEQTYVTYTLRIINMLEQQKLSYLQRSQIFDQSGSDGPKWDKPETFSNQISVHFALEADKCATILNLAEPKCTTKTDCPGSKVCLTL